MWFAGIDCADAHHDIAIVDEVGQQQGMLRVAHSAVGLEDLVSFLRGYSATDPEQVACIVEWLRARTVERVFTGTRTPRRTERGLGKPCGEWVALAATENRAFPAFSRGQYQKGLNIISQRMTAIPTPPIMLSATGLGAASSVASR